MATTKGDTTTTTADTAKIDAMLAGFRELSPQERSEVFRRVGMAPPDLPPPSPSEPGWDEDGIYHVSREQLADPLFCYSEEWATIQKSGKYQVIEGRRPRPLSG
jgi:hypothetical protein